MAKETDPAFPSAASDVSASAKTACRAAGRKSVIRHASTVAFGPYNGIVIFGPAGSGKSTLALALITAGARLVSDDRTCTWSAAVSAMANCSAQGATNRAVYARAPRAIAGLLERRGLGLIRLGCLRMAQVKLIIDLSQAETRRLPPDETITWHGITMPCLRAPARDDALASAFPAALRHYIQGPEFGRRS